MSFSQITIDYIHFWAIGSIDFQKDFFKDFCPQGNKRIIRDVKKSVSTWEICGTHIFQVLPVLFIHPIKKLTKHFVLSVFFLKFAPIKCKTRLTHLGQKCKIHLTLCCQQTHRVSLIKKDTVVGIWIPLLKRIM